jgi:diguanylate cyclase (GGDEF)-like protein
MIVSNTDSFQNLDRSRLLPSTNSQTETERLKIILVEDRRSDAILLQKTLNKSEIGSRFDVTHVTTLTEALVALKQNLYMAAILDLGLPDSEGLQSLESLRSHSPQLPIIVLTGMNDSEMGLAAVQLGAQDYLIKGLFNAERIASSLQFSIERQRLLAEVYDRNLVSGASADVDALTGLPNRYIFHDRLENALALCKRESKNLTLAAIDLDGFKEINDAMGFLTGDRLLAAVAKRLTQVTREIDTIARMDGDQFSCLFMDTRGVHDPCGIARRLCEVFEKPFEIDNETYQISASIGLSVYPKDADVLEELMEASASAMHRAKQLGRNQVRFHSPMLNASARQAKEMTSAFHRGEFENYYQVIVDLKTQDAVGIQAFARWEHPEWGTIEAEHFISLAEESGSILPLNEWLLDQAMGQLKTLQQRSGKPLALSMKLSKSQMQIPYFSSTVSRLLMHHHLEASSLILEVTEEDVLEGHDQGIEFLNKLRTLGVRISLNGLGTGTSSLENLRKFPLDRVKLDRTLVAKIMTDEQTRGISKALLGLSQSLGLETSAEGVEHPGQMTILTEMGCHLAQGFLFGKPTKDPEEI